MRRRRIWWVISVAVFVTYMIALCYLLFFSARFRNTLYGEGNYNLIPIRQIIRFMHASPRTYLKNVVGNIIAFLPFGFLIIPVSRGTIHFPVAAASCLGITALVECIQLLTKVGIFDVDDILLNFIGGMAGLGLYYAVRAIYRKKHTGQDH